MRAASANWGIGMDLFGRRWDRWDGIVAAAAVMLVIVSYQPWYTLHDEGSVTVWNAWTHWQLSDAVALGLLAAGLHLAYRGRPEAQGAAWMAAFMLLGGLGFVGWHWQHASAPKEKVVVSLRDMPPGETPEQRRRRFDEELAALIAKPPPAATRSTRWGFYAGAGSLILMGAAIARRVVRSQPSRAEAG
jgi:hypothetical protein